MVIPRTYGRMGNFLFQAAAAAAYAWDHNLEFTVPTTTNDAKWNPIYLQHLAKDFNPGLESVIIREEKEFCFRPIPFKEAWRKGNITLDGYWQSDGYFKQHREKLINAFAFRWTPKRGHVSVHVRRGDYLTIRKGNLLKHPTVTKQWLEEQMKKFPGARFVFFSDDLDWCQQEFTRADCVYHRGTEVDDLVGMSWCEHHICSASTFSWWGAWLNQNPKKRIIIPQHWLSPGWNGHENTHHIIPQEWEKA